MIIRPGTVRTSKGWNQSILCLEGTQLDSRLEETGVRVSGEDQKLPGPSHMHAATGWGQHSAQVQTKLLHLRKSEGDRCGTRCKGEESNLINFSQ